MYSRALRLDVAADGNLPLPHSSRLLAMLSYPNLLHRQKVALDVRDAEWHHHAEDRQSAGIGAQLTVLKQHTRFSSC